MDTIEIIKGSESGRLDVFHLNTDDAYALWSTHYDTDLKRLYGVFKSACYNNSVDWYRYIDFNTFKEFTYNNSSKYLTPW